MKRPKIRKVFIAFLFAAYVVRSNTYALINYGKENLEQTFASIPTLTYFADNIGSSYGCKDGYLTAGVVSLPFILKKKKVHPFIDFRGHCLTNGKVGLNLGFGLRYLHPSQHGIGVNAFYDYRQSQKGFNQIGFGFEYSGPIVDITFNYYLPVGGKVYIRPTETFYYPGDYVATCHPRDVTLHGVDGMVNTRLSNLVNRPLTLDFYAGIGFYKYGGCCGKAFSGGKAKIGIQYGDFIVLECISTYDPTFGTLFQGVIKLIFPSNKIITKNKLNQTWLNNWIDKNTFLFRPVERKEIIVEDKTQCMWTTNWE